MGGYLIELGVGRAVSSSQHQILLLHLLPSQQLYHVLGLHMYHFSLQIQQKSRLDGAWSSLGQWQGHGMR